MGARRERSEGPLLPAACAMGLSKRLTRGDCVTGVTSRGCLGSGIGWPRPSSWPPGGHCGQAGTSGPEGGGRTL